MKIYLIRHGMTLGNQEKRYVGSTDESISLDTLKLLSKKEVPMVSAIYVSPMKRCKETAQAIWPGAVMQIEEGLRECNFGEFEYKNYLELTNHAAYQLWIDSNGIIGFPGGESRFAFQDRCKKAFEQVMKDAFAKECDSIALVIHGGTIMAILDAYSCPHQEYYTWQVANGEGFQGLIAQPKVGKEYKIEELVPYE